MGLWEVLKGEEPGLITKWLNYENTGQLGEFVTEFALTNDNLDGELIVLKNLYIPFRNKTTEVDLMMIHEKGIFVFESKNYSGWIFGDAEQLNWVQSLPNGEKHKFYNPIRQNRTHITALSEYLGKSPSDFISYIIFSERCTLKSVPQSTSDVVIVRRPNMLKTLRATLKNSPPIYSHTEIQAMADKLKSCSGKTEAEKQQHIKDVQTKCPFCGNELVLRKGKYGQFWGCSSYPKCKYTRQIE